MSNVLGVRWVVLAVVLGAAACGPDGQKFVCSAELQCQQGGSVVTSVTNPYMEACIQEGDESSVTGLRLDCFTKCAYDRPECVCSCTCTNTGECELE